MYRLTLGTLCLILFFNIVIGKSCDNSDLINESSCPENHVCDETGTCKCQPGFKPFNETYCVEISAKHSDVLTPNSSSLVADNNSGGIIAGILIPVFLILFVIYGVYATRRYKLISWFRRKIHQRNNNYDEFMIGQETEDDDPPLN